MVNKVDGSANSTRLKVFDNRTSVPHKKQFTDQTWHVALKYILTFLT